MGGSGNADVSPTANRNARQANGKLRPNRKNRRQYRPSPEATAAAFVSKSGDKVLFNGFVCPAPQPKLEVKSTELNLFVWTEYISQDEIDCFEQVYGVRVNHGEYSANAG